MSFLLGDIPGDFTCTLGFSGSMTVMAAALHEVVDAACIATTVSIIGNVTEQSPHTFCCLP
jgi:hypothetical protein